MQQETPPATHLPDNLSEIEDIVEEASKESFPASDPPAFNLGEEGKRRMERGHGENQESSRKG